MRNIKLEDLATMTPQDIAGFPVGLLSELVDDLAAQQEHVKKIKTVLDAGIQEKYGSSAASIRAEDGKDTGTVRIEDGDFTVISNLPKKVKWDESILINAFNGMDPDMARHYAKVTYKVDERKFEAAPPEVRAMLLKARTLDTGKETIKIEGGDDA